MIDLDPMTLLIFLLGLTIVGYLTAYDLYRFFRGMHKDGLRPGDLFKSKYGDPKLYEELDALDAEGAYEGKSRMKNPQTCEHWEMAFCVIDPTIYIRCMACGMQAILCLDGADKFTTAWAKVALNNVRDEHVSSQVVQRMG